VRQDSYKRKLAAILCADVVEYTRLIEDNETATIKLLTTYRELIAKHVEQHNGRVVDAVGDNLLAEFASVVEAIQSAIAIQNEIKAQNTDVRSKNRILFRIGINLGDLAVEGERIYGDGVNITARLQTLAKPGGICISGPVYDQIGDKFKYQYLGEKHFKNSSKPIRAYEILLADDMTAFENETDPSDEDNKLAEKEAFPRNKTREELEKGLNRDLLSPILATKLYLPEPKQGFVQRTSLLEQLNKGIDRKLTLISAPAGYGKTTLLTQWITQNKLPTAWISLEKGESDPVQFMRYVIIALRSIEPNIGKAAWASFQSPQQVPIGTVIISLVDEIVNISNEFILVLDDFHTIENVDIHKTIGDLINLLPSKVHLVIATRVDPSLPLSILRVRNQINELRASDLCFSQDETTLFFNEMMNLELSNQEISILESRTEGWVAGLQLAALSMQGCKDTSMFIKAFAGDDRLIVDYLAEEVLNLQSAEVQQFLLQTSILNRLSGALCDFITQQKGSQKILDGLERANLFVISLDNKRHWYRYHHLFSDLLSARLHQSQPEIVAAIHRRASIWFEQNDQIVETINHALSAGDFDRVADLIEDNTLAMLAKGELHTFLDWIYVLPEKVARQRPWLRIYQAWSLAFAGRVNDIEPLLKETDQLLQRSDLVIDKSYNEDERQEMIGNIACIRAFVAVVTGGFSHAIEYANKAGEKLSEDNLWARSVFQWALGVANRMHGDLTVAERSCAEVVMLGRKMDNIWTIVTGLTDLAIVYQTRGQLYKTASLCQEAIELAAQRSMDNLGFTGRVEACLALVMYEQNDLKGALHFARSSVKKTQNWSNPNHFVYAYIALACVLQAQQDFKGASDCIAKADLIRSKFPILPVLSGMLEKRRVQLWLTQKRKSQVTRWAMDNATDDTYKRFVHSKVAGENEPPLFTLARVYISQAKMDEALELLNHLEKSAISSGRINNLIEALVLQTLTLSASKNWAAALQTMERCLALAEPGGYIRIFIDEGPLIAKLLEKCLDSKVTVPRAYVKKLLSAFRLSKLIKTDDELVEQLSDRELEVLRSIAAGLSNKKITESLFISLSTVKTHLRNIYGKLNVHSRTEAVAKADELDLL